MVADLSPEAAAKQRRERPELTPEEYLLAQQVIDQPDHAQAPWAGGKRGARQTVGRSRGSLTTKIVALVDAPGHLVRFVLLPGHRHDSEGADPLIEGIVLQAFIADKAFDADWLRKRLNARGAQVVIPPRNNRNEAIAYDRHMYQWRHLVENCFQRLKEFRAVATRYDKTDSSFSASIYLAAIVIALR